MYQVQKLCQKALWMHHGRIEKYGDVFPVTQAYLAWHEKRSAREKEAQIKATGADYCIAGCHNCHAQIHELSEHYGANYGVVHMWTLICLAMGILGENEREYLQDDLKEVAVYGA